MACHIFSCPPLDVKGLQKLWHMACLHHEIMKNTTSPAKPACYYAKLWAAQMPDYAAKLNRALPLAGRVSRGPEADTFRVAGETDSYLVRVARTDAGTTKTTCTCPDHLYRGLRCKHIFAAALAVKTRAVAA